MANITSSYLMQSDKPSTCADGSDGSYLYHIDLAKLYVSNLILWLTVIPI